MNCILTVYSCMFMIHLNIKFRQHFQFNNFKNVSFAFSLSVTTFCYFEIVIWGVKHVLYYHWYALVCFGMLLLLDLGTLPVCYGTLLVHYGTCLGMLRYATLRTGPLVKELVHCSMYQIVAYQSVLVR